MRRRAGGGNRAGVAFLGLLLLLAGGTLAAQSRRVFGQSAGGQVIYPPAARRFVHDNQHLWWALAAVAIVVGLLCLRWLLAQLRIGRLSRVQLDSDRTAGAGAGRSLLLAGALTDLVEADLGAQPGVRAVSAILTGRPDHPELRITLSVDPRADAAAARDYLVGELLPTLRAAINQPQLTGYVHISTTRRSRIGSQRGIRLDEAPAGSEPESAPGSSPLSTEHGEATRQATS